MAVSIVAGLLFCVIGCQIAGPVAGDTAVLPGGAVPADVTASIAPETEGIISRDQAIAAATKQYPLLLREGKVDAYLVSATDPSTRGPIAIKDRMLWILHVSGVEYPISIPYGRTTESDTAGNGYIYIDAYTGEWLLSRFEE